MTLNYIVMGFVDILLVYVNNKNWFNMLVFDSEADEIWFSFVGWNLDQNY